MALTLTTKRFRISATGGCPTSIFKDFKSMSSLVHLPRPPVEEGAGAAVPAIPVPGMCAYGALYTQC